MCGITGAVWTDPDKAIDASTLARMTETLHHRGPDGDGCYRADFGALPGREAIPGVALGHRRLAIIDLAGGQQPMANEDGSIQIVFNGEIYNFRSLRRRLEGAGHRFQTHCDTEVIVHLYEDEGVGCIEHLEGMFALAIWDGPRRQLLLARDRLGEKPLVYRHEPGRLLFASEIKSILAAPGVPRQIDPQAIDAYLTYQYVPHPSTIFHGIAKLPPGCLAVYRDDRLQVDRYWRPDFQAEEKLPEKEYSRRLRGMLTASVQARLESDVPLGAFLSGGIDSTIVVGLMQQLCKEPVRTFSIGFPVPEYDETHYARLAAERFGTIHREFRVEPDAMEILSKLVWHYDEPFADSSAVPTWYVSQLTRQHVTVALTGDGGDELFAGYNRYQAVALGSFLDRVPMLRRFLGAKLWQRLPSGARQKAFLRRVKRFSAALQEPLERRYLNWICIFNEAGRASLYSDEFLKRLPNVDPLEFLLSHWRWSNRRDPVTSAGLADLVTYLPCDLMAKVDTASMAHSLETRPPFLDHQVVELAARMPLTMKYRWGRGKRILLDTFADLFPPEILRRRKMGFGVPLDHWFRGPLAPFAREVLLDPRTLQRGYFRPEKVRTLLEDHVAGRQDASYRLWALLILELWHRCWVD